MAKADRIKRGKVTLNTSFSHTRVITGGDVNINIAEARAIYDLTAISTGVLNYDGTTSQEQLIKYEHMRNILRGISKAILFGGESHVTPEDLVSLFNQPIELLKDVDND